MRLENGKGAVRIEIGIAEARLADEEIRVTEAYEVAAKKLKIGNYMDDEESRAKVIIICE